MESSEEGYPLLQIPGLFSRVSCRPSTKKGGIYHGKPGFPKNAQKTTGILSRGYPLLSVVYFSRGTLPTKKGERKVSPVVCHLPSTRTRG